MHLSLLLVWLHVQHWGKRAQPFVATGVAYLAAGALELVGFLSEAGGAV